MKIFEIRLFFVGSLVRVATLEPLTIQAKDVYEAKRLFEKEFNVPKRQFVTAQPF